MPMGILLCERSARSRLLFDQMAVLRSKKGVEGESVEGGVERSEEERQEAKLCEQGSCPGSCQKVLNNIKGRKVRQGEVRGSAIQLASEEGAGCEAPGFMHRLWNL